MEKTVKLSAIRVANQLDLKGIKSMLGTKPLDDTSSELFYNYGPDQYQYYFNYGVVVFSSYSEEEINAAVKKIQPYMKSPDPWLRDDHDVSVVPGSELKFDFDRLVVGRVDAKIIRIAMFNLAQSVALDHYHEISDGLLAEIRSFTNHLESTGKLSINRKNMLKFIGRALNTQNDIADNIYIFDAPEQVWDNKELDSLHRGLMQHFDLRVRVSEIQYTLRIIDDNLKVFLQISNQRESNVLEWIIIILILVELLNIVIPKIF
jgi:uncharacterized Rmd1/YagE family protein